jgi:hypothetical protein
MNESSISTRVAWAGWDEHRHFGHRVFSELAGHETYAGLMAIAVGGRRLAPDERAVLEDVAAVLTVAEPRIWPNKAARMAASYGRPIPGILAGCLCFESELIGPWTTGDTARNLVWLRERVGDGASGEAVREAALELLRDKGRLLGFGVPFRPKDERLVALTERIAARGRSELPFWSLSTALWAELRAAKRLEPNIGSGIAAALLDLGFDPVQIPTLTIALNLNIFVANAFEASHQKSDMLRRLPDSHVRYVGAAARRSPRSTGDDPA